MFETSSAEQNEFNSSAFLVNAGITEWVLGSSPRMTTLLERVPNRHHRPSIHPAQNAADLVAAGRLTVFMLCSI